MFVGPASAWLCEQMNVLSSTRATSPGSEIAQNEFGRFAGSHVQRGQLTRLEAQHLQARIAITQPPFPEPSSFVTMIPVSGVAA